MKKLTQAEIILRVLRDNPSKWFQSWELIKVNTPYGWLGLADRQARELAESGKIERRHEGKFAEYRTKEFTPKVQYRVIGRPDIIIKQY